jgi:predicted anti-sigma-YlaC factor YlaD
MPCEHTATLVAESFDDTLPALRRAAHDAHLQQCPECQQALTAARAATAHLQRWREQPVPEWSRPRAPVSETPQRAARWQWWQWAPLAMSFVLALAVMTNVQVSTSTQGMAIHFGAAPALGMEDVEARLAAFEAQQQLALQTLTQALAEQQSADNARLMEAVIDSVVEQFGDSTARSLEQVIAYFESQRQQDLQLLRTSYQQLADSDYATIRSVEQLASLVQGGQP